MLNDYAFTLAIKLHKFCTTAHECNYRFKLMASSINLCTSLQVVTLLTHLNKRLKSRPKIQLPVKSLLLQYQVSSQIGLQYLKFSY